MIATEMTVSFRSRWFPLLLFAIYVVAPFSRRMANRLASKCLVIEHL
jgi:hypothetical protein